MLVRRSWVVIAAVSLLAACTASDGATGSSDVTASTSAALSAAPSASAPDGEGPAGAGSLAGDTPAPEFPEGLDWLNTATPLSLAALRGKVVLLDFWTYGCINCIHILPDLERLEEEFAEELVVIGVHSAKFVNESASDNIRQVILRYGIDHPVVNDRDFAVWDAWGAGAWPTTVVVDPAGNVVGGHAGEGVYDVVQPVIASLVAEFDATGALDRTPVDLVPERSRQPSRILSFPGKVTVDAGGSRLFIADTGHHRIVAAHPTTGDVLGVYGSGRRGFADGDAVAASFDSPQGLAFDAAGAVLYVADTNNHAIRTVDTATGRVGTLVGTGRLGWPPTGGTIPGLDLNSPWDLLVDGTTMYVAMAGHHQVWTVDLDAGVALPLVGSGREGVLNGPFDQAELAQPSGLALSDDGILYLADSESSSIRSADLVAPVGRTALVAGASESLFDFGSEDGTGEDARFQHPLGVVIRPTDGTLIVADTYNSRLRRLDPVTREVTTLAGGEQGWRDGSDPLFYEPGGIAVAGETLYVADTNNHAIRVVDLTTTDTSTMVLKGIETFEPPPGSADYRGTVVDVEPIEVAAGEGEIVLDIALPDGHRVNAEAPSSLLLGPADVVAAAGGPVDLTGTELPVHVPVTFRGSGELLADATIIYCRDEATTLCLIEQVRFAVPVTVAPGGDSVIALTHDISLPGPPGG